MADVRHWFGDGCPAPHGDMDLVTSRWPAETISDLARCGLVTPEHAEAPADQIGHERKTGAVAA